MSVYDDHFEVLREWVDRETNVLWREVRVAPFGASGTMVHAVCRPESCADVHRCGKLDLGILRAR